MKFNEVTATHFGPFRGDTLHLAPGFTVVHGPNESGKSTWAAALFAVLAGRRRARGRGTGVEAQFRKRHQPWRGSRWQVGATIALDSGDTLDVTQDLVGGTTAIVPAGAERALGRKELEERFGLTHTDWADIDVGELFGLSRETLRSIIFVPQADILRVLQDAKKLQEFIQRAATTESLDVTAHQVLEKLKDEASTRVGSESIGQRPLRRTLAELEEAKKATYALRAARDELRLTAARVSGLRGDEERARAELERVRVLQVWAEADALEQRLAKVRGYDEQLAGLASIGEPAADDLVERLRAALNGFLNRDALPEEPPGPSADELREQLAELPEMPEGDTAPDPAVRGLWEALNRVTSSLDSREDLDHAAPAEGTLPDASSDELREFATQVRAARPVWDATHDEDESRLRDQYDHDLAQHARDLPAWQERSASHEEAMRRYTVAKERYDAERVTYEQEVAAFRGRQPVDGGPGRRASDQYARSSAGPSLWLLIAGGVLVVIGLLMLLLDPVIGGAGAAVGVAVLVAGLVMRGRRPARVADPSSGTPSAQDPPVAPTPPEVPIFQHPGDKPREPVISDRVDDIVRRRDAWQRAASEFDQRRVELTTLLGDRGLPIDPNELEGLARRIDEREGAKKLADEQREEIARLRVEVGDAAHRLVDALRAKGPLDVANPRDAREADAAYRRYEEACAERAVVAREAQRREELTRTLEIREQADQAYREAVGRDAARAEAVVAAAREVDADTGDDPDQAAGKLEDWLGAQNRAREARHVRDNVLSLREQQLDGATTAELEEQLTTLTSGLGERPEHLPSEVDELVAGAAKAVEDAATERAGAEGELARLRRSEGDLAQAVEAEAALSREKSSLEELKSILDLVAGDLEVAQQEAHRNISPVLERAIRGRLPLVTQGRYQDVRVKAETLAVELLDPSGTWRDAALLSQGTTEQTYLLLRLALVENLGTDEAMPLILDDVTVQCDAARTVALLDLLHEVSKERQVVLFSQETGVRAWAREKLADPQDRLIELEGPVPGRR